MFVTDQVVVPVPPRGSNCYVLSSFALGSLAPSKASICASSLAVRNGGSVLMHHIQAALTAEGSPLLLEPRPRIYFFSQLVAEPIGMFVGRGLIQTVSMQSPRLHYFSYDAGRQAFYDRGGEITLLEAEDLTETGSKVLFYRKFAVDGKANLGWIDLREICQVMRA